MTNEVILKNLKLMGADPDIRSVLEMISGQFGMELSAMSLITGERWLAAAVCDHGKFDIRQGDDLPLEQMICGDVRRHGEPVIIADADSDQRYARHPMTARYAFQSFISFPIRHATGDVLGTLVGIGHAPGPFPDQQAANIFRLYADLIGFYLASKYDISLQAVSELQHQRDCKLRELQIAVLGHDLQNPVTAINNAAKIITKRSNDKQITEMALVVGSSGQRIAAMVNNILSFSRNHAGQLWLADILPDPALQDKLELTVAEYLVNTRGRTIERLIDLQETVHCDSTMILQVAANLLSNALTHGYPEAPVFVEASSDLEYFTLSVRNSGEKIPEPELAMIFQPFSQAGNADGRKKGLGLGLHIVSEIAAAHRGTVRVASEEQFTTFTLTIPNKQQNRAAGSTAL